MGVESISKAFLNFIFLNYHLKSYLYKKHLLYLSTPKVFLIILVFYIWLVKIQNRRWLYLDNHLERLLAYSFLLKSLGVALM
jgi:hypothetical protein